jgi:hypothetical protein
MVMQIIDLKLTPAEDAASAGVSEPSARNWLGRFLAQGPAALADASSRPRRSPRAIHPSAGDHRAASPATHPAAHRSQPGCVQEHGQPCARPRAGLSRLSELAVAEPIRRYEHAAPGDLLHIDTKKLGRIERASHRVTHNRRDRVVGAGWEFLFVAIDDHARVGFTKMYPDERYSSAVAFVQAAAAYHASPWGEH